MMPWYKKVWNWLGHLSLIREIGTWIFAGLSALAALVAVAGWMAAAWLAVVVGLSVALIAAASAFASYKGWFFTRASTSGAGRRVNSPFSQDELSTFRSELADVEDGDPTTTGAYSSMRPHLSRRTRWRIESGRYTSAGDPNWKISLLMDQIAHWEEQLAGREWSRAPDAEPPSLEGLGREHMERLESLLDGARRLSKSDPMTRVLHDGGLIFLQRDLQDGTAFFRIHPEIQSDVLTWRRDDIREFMDTNDHIPFQEFLELFTTDHERHQVSPEIFNAARALGRRKLVEWEDGERVMIREEMTDVAREVAGLLERRSVVLEKREDSASTSD